MVDAEAAHGAQHDAPQMRPHDRDVRHERMPRRQEQDGARDGPSPRHQRNRGDVVDRRARGDDVAAPEEAGQRQQQPGVGEQASRQFAHE